MTERLAYYDGYDTGEAAITGPPNYFKGGQTFTATNSWSIEYIKIYGRRRDTAVDVGDAKLSIQGVTGADDDPDGNILRNKTFDAQLWNVTDEWHTITFDTAIDVDKGAKRAIVLELLDAPVFPGMIYWEYNNDPGSFAGGERHTETGGVWGVQPSMDLLFEIWGTPTPPPGKATTPTPTDDAENIKLTGINQLKVLQWEAPA